MFQNTLYLTEQAWIKYGEKTDKDVFPKYQRRLLKLRQLCGTYKIGLGIPDWWQELIQEIEEKGWWDIAKLFWGTSVEEFRQGQFQTKCFEKYLKQFKSYEKKIISSPKIGKFLKEQFGAKHRLTIAFRNRRMESPRKEAVITADPWDIVNMASRGKSWTSCQNFLENKYCEVWANLCDPGMIIVFVRTQGDESKKNMDTRVILRYARTNRKNRGEAPMRGVIIDKFYGDAAYISEIQKLILKLCRKHGLCLFEYKNYDSHQDNINAGCQTKPGSENEDFIVYGPPVKFPNNYTSHVDNSEWIEEEKRPDFYYLKAEVRLLFAPPTSNAAV